MSSGGRCLAACGGSAELGEGRHGLSGTRPSGHRPTCQRERPAVELGRRGRSARVPRCARRSGRRPPPAGKLGSPEVRLPAAPEVCSGARGRGGAGQRAGRSDSRSRPRARRTDASSWVILSLLSWRSPLLWRGEGCRGEGKDGAASLRFPGGALLEDFFLLRSLKRSVSRKSSVELGVSCGQAFAPTI